MNPLDLTYVGYTQAANGTNQTVCVNSFSRADIAAEAGADFILGDAFLRNVYSLFAFGNWTNSSAPTPYVQLLSVSTLTTF